METLSTSAGGVDGSFGANLVDALNSSPPHTNESPTITPPLSAGTPVELNSEENCTLVSQLTITTPPNEQEERPSLSYKDLIIEAIESSPEKRLKLSEIYQVIRYLHPYYRKRADQWGWNNSIRHNLSLHDCFVKLPLKQTSASGVVGHFWTVARESEENRGSSRRRSRNGPRLQRCTSSKVASAAPKIKSKGRQSVSSDSGVMSDESQANSPNVLLLVEGGLVSRQDSIPSSNVASAPQLHRPLPTYAVELQKSPLPPSAASTNLLMMLAANPSLASNVDTTALLSSFPEVMNSSQTLSGQQFLSSLALGSLHEETSGTAVLLGGLDSASGDQLQRLRLLNVYLYQQQLLQQLVTGLGPTPQQQQEIQSLGAMFLNQLSSKTTANVRHSASPVQLPSAPTLMDASSEFQSQLLSFLGQQLSEGNPLFRCPDSSTTDSIPAASNASSKDNLVVI